MPNILNNFDWHHMVSELVTHPDVLSNFHVLCYESELEVTNEFALNLMEKLLAVYLEHVPFPILMVQFNTISLYLLQQKRELLYRNKEINIHIAARTSINQF